MTQIEEYRQGARVVIEVSRLDSARDYIHVRDIARGIRKLVEGKPTQAIYNLGSGRSTTNQEVVDLLIKHCKIEVKPKIKETMREPEPIYAIQADISRIREDVGWIPKISIDNAIEDIANGSD